MLFLDLSAAFDTIDTNKLFCILKNEIRVTGKVLKGFSLYLKGQTQRVEVKSSYSSR